MRKRLVADHSLALDPNMVQIDLVADRRSALATRLTLVLLLAGLTAFAVLRKRSPPAA